MPDQDLLAKLQAENARLEVVPRSRFAEIDLPPEAGIQDVFRHLAQALTELRGGTSVRSACFLCEIGHATMSS